MSKTDLRIKTCFWYANTNRKLKLAIESERKKMQTIVKFHMKSQEAEETNQIAGYSFLQNYTTSLTWIIQFWMHNIKTGEIKFLELYCSIRPTAADFEERTQSYYGHM